MPFRSLGPCHAGCAYPAAMEGVEPVQEARGLANAPENGSLRVQPSLQKTPVPEWRQ